MKRIAWPRQHPSDETVLNSIPFHFIKCDLVIGAIVKFKRCAGLRAPPWRARRRYRERRCSRGTHFSIFQPTGTRAPAILQHRPRNRLLGLADRLRPADVQPKPVEPQPEQPPGIRRAPQERREL